MRFSLVFLSFFTSAVTAALASGAEAVAEHAEPAAGHAEHASHALPLYPESVIHICPGVDITNSMIVVWIAVIIITLFCRAATSKMKLVPGGLQNFAEWIVESLYNFLESILGTYMVKKTFWFFASVFLLIFVTNLLFLIPGMGSVGYVAHGKLIPFLRGGNADLNMTMAMSLVFAVLWFYWAIAENGFKGFLAHIFAPKGEFTGVMLAAMIPVFLVVGALEMISIAIRPVALTFRLFGNIYGGEQTMENLMTLLPCKWLAFLPTLPFYFMELLVGFIQALVFMLLTAVFVRVICDHAGEEHH